MTFWSDPMSMTIVAVITAVLEACSARIAYMEGLKGKPYGSVLRAVSFVMLLLALLGVIVVFDSRPGAWSLGAPVIQGIIVFLLIMMAFLPFLCYWAGDDARKERVNQERAARNTTN